MTIVNPFSQGLLEGAVVDAHPVRTHLDVIGIIGILLLIGIVKKSGIMMVDVALEPERDRHLGPEVAIFEACGLRFRPILMTTMCALLGGVTLMIGTGSELRQPLGFAMVGGLAVSQVLILLTTPIVYIYLDKLRHIFGRRSGARPVQIAHAAEWSIAATQIRHRDRGAAEDAPLGPIRTPWIHSGLARDTRVHGRRSMLSVSARCTLVWSTNGDRHWAQVRAQRYLLALSNKGIDHLQA